MRIDIRDSRDNKYLNDVLTKIDFSEVAFQQKVNNMKRVNKLHTNKHQLDKLYELSVTKRTQGEEEWYNITKKLNKVYEFLTDDWVDALDDGCSPVEDFSKIFEALVFQVLKHHNTIKILKYEPEISVQGYKITPDFVVDNKRIVEVKLSRNGAFKNEAKYRKFDANLIKVYLSKKYNSVNFDKGGCVSINTLIKNVEQEVGYKLTYEREMVKRMIKGRNTVFANSKKMTSQKRTDVLFKIDVLRAQVKAILRSINKNK